MRNLATDSETPTFQGPKISGFARGHFVDEDLTVKQKNRTKNAMNKNGTSSHPTPLRTAKNPSSIGSVTKKSAPMTSFKLGFFLASPHLSGAVKAYGRADGIE